jgi:hypothetical protein
MRSSLKLDPRIGLAAVRQMSGALYRLLPVGDPEDDEGGEFSFGPAPVEREELPYRVELWDAARASVEQVLAITANGSIGYAAYYAATREFPHRYITLRHKNRIVSRWNSPRK